MKKIFLSSLLLVILSIALLFLYLRVTTEYIFTTIAIEAPFENLENILDTQTEIIKSQSIITKALQELNISTTKLSSIQQRVFVERVKNSSILKISISKHATPQAKNILNSLVNIYISSYNQKNKQSQLAPLKLIDTKLQKVDKHIEELALKLEKFRKDTYYEVTSTNSLQKRLLEINIELDMLTRLSKGLHSSKKIEKLLVGGIYMSKNRENKILEESITQLQQSIMQMKILLADYTKEYPEVIKLNRKILQLKGVTLAIIKNSKKSYNQEKKRLEAYIKNQRALLEKMPYNERVVSSLQEQLSINRKLYNSLLEKKLNRAIKGKKSTQAYIIDQAIESSYIEDNLYFL